MTHIKIAELNPSHPEIGSEFEELTNEELLAINGGDGGLITDGMRFVARHIAINAGMIDLAADVFADTIRAIFGVAELV